MIDGCGLAPGVEFGHTFWHRPPHAARATEVVGWAGVVDRSAVGRRNHALESLERFGNIKMGAAELFDRVVTEALHPLLQFIGSVQLARLVIVQDLDGLLHCRARLNFAGNSFLLCCNSGEFFATPLVGFVEVYFCAQKLSAEKRIALATDCIFGVCLRQKL